METYDVVGMCASGLPHLCITLAAWLAMRVLQRALAIADLVGAAARYDAAARSEANTAAAAGLTPSASGRDKPPMLRAGFSCPKVPPGTAVDHAWSELDASTFSVRVGPDYPRYGRKAPSGPALGCVVAVDTLRTEHKIKHLMKHRYIALPAPTPGWSEPYAEFVVVNQMIPTRLAKTVFTNADTDGETLNLVTYIRLAPGIGKGWRPDSDPQGPEQLLRRFLLRAEQDGSVAHCLKEIGMVLNFGEIEKVMPRTLTAVLKRFNGKPILTRPEHTFYRAADNSYLQIDLDVHQYKLATRIPVDSIIRFSSRIEMAYGVTVEARREQEMPEVMMFSMNLMRMHRERAVPFPPKELLRAVA